MSMVPPVVLIVMGTALVIGAVRARTFYELRGLSSRTDKQVDPTAGRIVLCICGTVLVIGGVWFLVQGLRQ